MEDGRRGGKGHRVSLWHPFDGVVVAVARRLLLLFAVMEEEGGGGRGHTNGCAFFLPLRHCKEKEKHLEYSPDLDQSIFILLGFLFVCVCVCQCRC